MALKNAVLHYLTQARNQNKASSLTAILEKHAIAARKKKMEQEALQKEISEMGLVQRLDTLGTKTDRISDDRFEQLKDSSNMLGKEYVI